MVHIDEGEIVHNVQASVMNRLHNLWTGLVNSDWHIFLFLCKLFAFQLFYDLTVKPLKIMHKQYFFSKGLWKQNDAVVVAALMYVLNHRLDHNNYTTHLAEERNRQSKN